jgi:sulfatase maturation enzyme AslB (radical SAM superfamily)
MGRIDQTIQMLERFIARKERLCREHPLRYLFWEATLRCNLNCLHCGSDCYKDNRTAPDELDVAAIKDELTAIAECYDPQKITFAIIGGEPLLRPDIITVCISTNRNLETGIWMTTPRYPSTPLLRLNLQKRWIQRPSTAFIYAALKIV